MIEIKVIHNNPELGSTALVRSDEVKAKNSLIKFIESSHWASGQWDSNISDISKVVDGVTLYYHPSNFTYTIRDKVLNPTQEELDMDARKLEIQQIRAMVTIITNSNLETWHKKLLKRLIREMKD